MAHARDYGRTLNLLALVVKAQGKFPLAEFHLAEALRGEAAAMGAGPDEEVSWVEMGDRQKA